MDENNGCAAGVDYSGGNYTGTIIKTTNGGTDWTTQLSGFSYWLFSIYFIDSNNGWVVGSEGTILRTANGGNNWLAQTSGTNEWLMGVCFVDASKGTVVGSNGIILRTTNAGSNWLSQVSGTTKLLRGVSFSDENYGTAVGDSGTILRTTNGGNNWISQNSGTLHQLNAVSFTDQNNGTIVGNNGIILHTTNGGVSFVREITDEELPTDFVLYQNYPNPFNPTTSIKFTIANLRFTILKVYNVLGKEVATLVNEELPAGEYEIEFNASTLASGIYFYELSAGKFSETKKMVLLR
jgi:photosystem II stability/assembly factor-like uncharacterized protein